ncbi:MAG: hypothetical protein P8Y45_02545 [Exilibacterium sp.]
MKLTIPAWKNNHYISLAELLLLIGRFFVNLKWFVRIAEVAPEPGSELIEAIDPMKPIDIFTLLHLVTPNIQIIDGTIVATESEAATPILILRAVDSTSWDIETENNGVETIVREAFPGAQDFD